jgi:tetratricopeptide (TPR) repeat protein
MATSGHNQAGVQAFNQGQYVVALQRFQLAADGDPLNADAVYNMARVHHELGTKGGSTSDLERAETYYNQTLDIDPNHTAAHRALAVLLIESGRTDSAFRLLKNWTTTSPQAADARVELARLYEEFGDKETAILHLNQAIALDGQNTRAWTALANLRQETGDLNQALANYQRSLTLNSMQPTIASRIEHLRRATSTGFGSMSPNGTRTVTPTIGGTRY